MALMRGANAGRLAAAKCVDQMLFTLSPSNVLSSASVAVQLGDKHLEEACLEYWATVPNRWALHVVKEPRGCLDSCCSLRT